jgi:hypothetical protein
MIRITTCRRAVCYLRSVSFRYCTEGWSEEKCHSSPFQGLLGIPPGGFPEPLRGKILKVDHCHGVTTVVYPCRIASQKDLNQSRFNIRERCRTIIACCHGLLALTYVVAQTIRKPKRKQNSFKF